MSHASVVCIVDDDPGVREFASRILQIGGYGTAVYASPAEFLADFDEERCACVVSDLKMPGMDGAELLSQLRRQASDIAVIILTGHADVRTAVELMEGGALTLLEKPFEPRDLLERVARAIDVTRVRRLDQQRSEDIERRLTQLSDQEQAIMAAMVMGLATKAIAGRVALSTRTVERRMRSVLEKMDVGSTTELAALIAKRRPKVDLDVPEIRPRNDSLANDDTA